MKAFVLIFALFVVSSLVYAQDSAPDSYQTSKGKLTVHFIGHGTLMLDFNGKIIHVDPWSRLTDYSKQPKADAVLITHAHQDHLDTAAIRLIQKSETRLLVNQESNVKIGRGEVMRNGDKLTVSDILIEAVPAYNTTAGRERFHPKGNGNGYMLNFGDLRVYVAGDTEFIPEMATFGKIDVAFLPVNQPYTMVPDQVLKAVEVLKPKVLYPYHYGETSMEDLSKLLQGISSTRLVVKSMK